MLINLRCFLASTATSLAVAACAAPTALALEPFTPQAIDANATFLSYAPAVPGRPDMKVCVVDTGVDLTTDAAPAVVSRETFFTGGPVDDGGGAGLDKHGTYVAGVIASQANDAASVGIWPRAKIVSVRVFRDRQSGTTTNAYVVALNTCVDEGAKVVNLSLSGLETAGATELAQLGNKITTLRTSFGVDVVAAAGNSGKGLGYPAAFPGTFSVGATNSVGDFCPFSSRGAGLDISILGCGVQLTYITGGVTHGDGTSLAAPVVSGVLAALRYYRPDLTPTQAEQLLTDNATVGAAGPRLNAAQAFRVAGLGSLVEAPAPAIVRTTRLPMTSASAPAITVVEVPVLGSAPSTDPLAELHVRRPTLRSKSYGKGVLKVVVSGVPDFGRAIFKVDKRRYVRPNGRLRVRLKRAPKDISVVIDVAEVGHSSPLRIRFAARRGG
jgi:hypothetical protein